MIPMRRRYPVVMACCFLLSLILQLSPAASDLTIGSPDTATADPPVDRPEAAPSVVTLFSGMEFADWNIKNFSYSPPPDCPGPWAKVVLVADFNVTAGVQYDRTCQITVGRVNVYYGTTPEPSPDFGPTWHIERDLTDYSALFASPREGEAILGNIVNDTYTGIIYGTAKIEFYPAASSKKLPKVPDSVLNLHDGSGGAVILNTAEDSLSRTFELASNIEAAYLDVFAQAQHDDEFWFTCVPDYLSADLESCGATAFREAQISLDGLPAGIAPVYPWIYTGCIDPYLWGPIPGVQAINFVPYRVDLTPYAAMLSDGQPHTVSLSVYNANSYFLADAALLLYFDEGSTQVTGEVTENTLISQGGPNPLIADNLDITDESITGKVSVTSAREYIIAGYVKTSHGKVKTKVKAGVEFSNIQDFTIDNDNYIQDIKQNTIASMKTTTTKGGSVSETRTSMDFPLAFGISQQRQSDGKINLLLAVNQQYNLKIQRGSGGKVNFTSKVSNEMFTTDTLVFSSLGQYKGHKDQKSSQRYKARDSKGYCWNRYIETADGVLTMVEDGCK
jgi:hypothetical protein